MRSFIIPTKPPRPAAKGNTPDHLRQQAAKARLRKSGGKRISFNLTAESLRDIETIRARSGHKTQLQAVEEALRAWAARPPA